MFFLDTFQRSTPTSTSKLWSRGGSILGICKNASDATSKLTHATIQPYIWTIYYKSLTWIKASAPFQQPHTRRMAMWDWLKCPWLQLLLQMSQRKAKQIKWLKWLTPLWRALFDEPVSIVSLPHVPVSAFFASFPLKHQFGITSKES